MNCDSPFYVQKKAALEAVPVGCGKCPSCKKRRVDGWVFRLLQEEKISQTSHFITLTYDTRFVPITKNGFMTLRKEDFQNYMKRLRKLCPDAKLKYYAVGEYGSQTKRPHYHAIIFNVPDTQLFVDAWFLNGQQIGSVHVGAVSGDSIAYCMKYIDKPHTRMMHGRDDREKEFPLMSKKLGANYLTDEMVAYHQSDLTRLYATKEGGHRVALPRYYRNKIYSEDQQKQQLRLIQSAVLEQDDQLRRDYEAVYGSNNEQISFETWKDMKRHGRYQSFYDRQKNRNL